MVEPVASQVIVFAAAVVPALVEDVPAASIASVQGLQRHAALLHVMAVAPTQSAAQLQVARSVVALAAAQRVKLVRTSVVGARVHAVLSKF